MRVLGKVRLGSNGILASRNLLGTDGGLPFRELISG